MVVKKSNTVKWNVKNNTGKYIKKIANITNKKLLKNYLYTKEFLGSI